MRFAYFTLHLLWSAWARFALPTLRVLVSLSTAKDLTLAQGQILRCAQDDRLLIWRLCLVEFGDALGEEAAFGFEFGGLQGGAISGQCFFAAAEGLQ